MRKTLSMRKRAAFSVFATVTLFVLLNLAALPFAPPQTVFWENPLMVMYPVESFDQHITLEQMNLNQSQDRPVRYVPDPERWYRLDPEPVIPSDGKFILHFGDSSTWGWGLTNRDHAYASALQRLLPAGIHSINLGVPGYSSLQGMRYLEDVLSQWASRTVAITLYFGNNDATENGMPDTEKLAQSRQGYTPALRVFPLVRLLGEFVKPLQKRTTNSAPRVSPDAYGQNMTRMIALAHAYGIPVVVIAPPVHSSWPPGHVTHTLSLESRVRGTWSGDELLIAEAQYQEACNVLYQGRDECEELFLEVLEHDWVVPRIKRAWSERLRSVCVETGVPILTTQEVFITAEFPWVFVDYCHPSASTHQKIAESIARTLDDVK